MIHSLDKKSTQDILIEKNLIKALPEVIGALFFDPERYTYSLRNILSIDMIRDMQMHLTDLPKWIQIRRINIKKTDKKTTQRSLGDIEFMQYDTSLIPLWTHISKYKDSFFVYPIEEDKKKLPLYDYILEKLPERITLYRVLSAGEAKKFEESDKEDIGSTHPLYWTEKTVHTSIHNISSEFIQEDTYNRLIGFEFSKDQIKKLLDSGIADIGTYSSIFCDRDPKSPLPFDTEMIFHKESFDMLMEGYKRRKENTGRTYLENPFYTKIFPEDIVTESKKELDEVLDYDRKK